MPAVSNSSPLIFYAVIGRLELLRETYGEIIVPPTVWRETVAVGSDRRGASAIGQASWIRRHAPLDQAMSTPRLADLDAGEAEVIGLAIPILSRITVLLDDLRARCVAEAIGLQVSGSAGALVQAKRLGLIPEVSPILTELGTAGLYLGEPRLSGLCSLLTSVDYGASPKNDVSGLRCARATSSFNVIPCPGASPSRM